jgi:histidyl-tRNA synthetase
VGGSIGLTRLFYVLAENNLVKSQTDRVVDVAVVPITELELPYAVEIAEKLLKEGKVVTVVASNKKLGDKLKYAAAIAKQGIVIGEAEAKSGKYELRDFS